MRRPRIPSIGPTIRVPAIVWRVDCGKKGKRRFLAEPGGHAVSVRRAVERRLGACSSCGDGYPCDRHDYDWHRRIESRYTRLLEARDERAAGNLFRLLAPEDLLSLAKTIAKARRELEAIEVAIDEALDGERRAP